MLRFRLPHDAQEHGELIVHLRPHSPVAESVHNIRTGVMLLHAELPSKALLITSVAPKEGKTVVAANLAIALAQAGRNVLLVDADMRRPRLGKLFQVDSQGPGLVQLLRDDVPLEAAVRPTGIERLGVLHCPTSADNPSEFLESQRLAAFIASAKERYDFVLFDSPPLLAVTDAIVLASRVDGVVWVVKGGATPPDLLRRGMAMLTSYYGRGESAQVEHLYDITMQTGLLLLVIFTPLAFGAVYPWGIPLMELVVLLMALAWGLTQLHGRRLRVVRTPLNLPILLFLGLVGLQLLPLPPGLMGALSPNTYGLQQRTLSGWPDRDPLPLIPPADLLAHTGVLVYTLWLGLDHVVERFFQPDEGRPLIWSGTRKLIGDYPLLGSGLGTYVSSFRRHKPPLDAGLVEHAHNDYLELLAEAGAVGFLIVVGGLGWFCWRILQRWFGRHDPEMRAIVLGGLTGVLAIGVHSLVDFNLHIPANALTFAVILGMIAAAVHLRRHHDRSFVVFRVRQVRLPRLLCVTLYPLVILATLMLGRPVVHSLAADRQAQLAQSLEHATRHTAEPELLIEPWAHAVALDLGNADYHCRLGVAYERIMRTQWTRPPSSAFISSVQAMVAFRQAILRNPTSPFPYLAWGWALEDVSRLSVWLAGQRIYTAPRHALGGDGLRDLRRQLAQHSDHAAQWSRELVRTATHLVPTPVVAHYSAGLHRLQRWDMVPPEEQIRVVQELRSAIQLEPRYAATILPTLWEHTHDRELVQTLARGTPDERRWRADASATALHR